MCEMLGGSLSGNGATDPKRGRFANGMLSFYVEPKVFDPAGFFPADIAKYVAFVKSSKPAGTGGEVLVPGEPESRTRAKRLAEGVPLPDDTWAAIVETARSVGLDERRIQQAVAP
jgi:hydroxycarboxylate dehydrogenase B